MDNLNKILDIVKSLGFTMPDKNGVIKRLGEEIARKRDETDDINKELHAEQGKLSNAIVNKKPTAEHLKAISKLSERQQSLEVEIEALIKTMPDAARNSLNELRQIAVAKIDSIEAQKAETVRQCDERIEKIEQLKRELIPLNNDLLYFDSLVWTVRRDMRQLIVAIDEMLPRQ